VLNYDNKPLSVLSISVKGIWGPGAPFLPKAWFYTALHIWKLNIFEKEFRKPITRLITDELMVKAEYSVNNPVWRSRYVPIGIHSRN
jgi:hypothetical protein